MAVETIRTCENGKDFDQKISHHFYGSGLSGLWQRSSVHLFLYNQQVGYVTVQEPLDTKLKLQTILLRFNLQTLAWRSQQLIALQNVSIFHRFPIKSSRYKFPCIPLKLGKISQVVLASNPCFAFGRPTKTSVEFNPHLRQSIPKRFRMR